MPATDILHLARGRVALDQMVCTQIASLPKTSFIADQTISVHCPDISALSDRL